MNHKKELPRSLFYGYSLIKGYRALWAPISQESASPTSQAAATAPKQEMEGAVVAAKASVSGVGFRVPGLGFRVYRD